MSLAPHTQFRLPAELSATEPAEARGLERDEVRLLVARPHTVTHARFRDLGRFLSPGDLLVVNTSGTLPAAVDGTRSGGDHVVVHFSTKLDEHTWLVELRSAPDAAVPIRNGTAGEQVELPAGAALTLRHAPGGSRRMWSADARVEGGVAAFLSREGRPIRYSYVADQWPLASYQTVFAIEPGSAEMPSAGRPFTSDLVTRLVAAGVAIAPITLHTGVSSLDSDEPPLAERFRVPATTARQVGWAKSTGGRVIAVGTTVVRALESAVAPDGSVMAASGWTDLVLGSDRPATVATGLITGLHAPEASHLLLLEALAGPELVQDTYDAALQRRYLWHEFGDMCLLLPDR